MRGRACSVVQQPVGSLMRRLAVVLIITAVAAILPNAAPAAVAADCPPAGGVTVPRAARTDADFTVLGKGWGHGVGMSQYGARGAAELGCSSRQILQTYYRGVSVGDARTHGIIRVGLTSGSAVNNRVSTRSVDTVEGALDWQLCDTDGCKTVAWQRPGKRWQVRVGPRGKFALWREDKRMWRGGSESQLLRAPLTKRGVSRIIRLPVSGNAYKWGTLEFDSVASTYGSAYVNLIVGDMERYLRGLAEMPSSWETAALRAQAIVGRSYALNKLANGQRLDCRCHVWDSPADQAFTGWNKESEGAGAVFGKRWVAAVRGSAQRIIRDPSGGIAVGYYSSSHGGASESSAFTWGGEVSYLQSVDDSRWEMSSGNAIRSWSVGISAKRLGALFGVGSAIRISRPRPRGAAGRVGRPEAGYGGVRIEGTQGSVQVSGEAFKARLGLRSTLFTVVKRDPELRAADAAMTANVGHAGAVAAGQPRSWADVEQRPGRLPARPRDS